MTRLGRLDAGTVTGSKFLARRGGSRLLVDRGLFQGLASAGAVVHSEPDAAATIAARLRTDFDLNAVVPRDGEQVLV